MERFPIGKCFTLLQHIRDNDRITVGRGEVPFISSCGKPRAVAEFVFRQVGAGGKLWDKPNMGQTRPKVVLTAMTTLYLRGENPRAENRTEDRRRRGEVRQERYEKLRRMMPNEKKTKNFRVLSTARRNCRMRGKLWKSIRCYRINIIFGHVEIVHKRYMTPNEKKCLRFIELHPDL